MFEVAENFVLERKILLEHRVAITVSGPDTPPEEFAIVAEPLSGEQAIS